MCEEELLTPRERRFLEENPDAVRTSKPQNNGELSGVEGWLLFLVVSLVVLGPLATILMTAADLNQATEIYPNAVGTALWENAKLIAWVSAAAFCIISVYAGITLAKKHVRSSVTVAIACLWTAGPVLGIASLMAMGQAGGEPNASDFGAAVGRPVIWAGIWTAYLLRSKRVQHTYLAEPNAERATYNRSGLTKRSRQLIFFSGCWVIMSFIYFMLMSPFGDYPGEDEVRRTWAIILLPPIIIVFGSWIYSRFVGSDD